MPESLRYGTLKASIVELPNSVAKAWLDYLGEDERLSERGYVEIDQVAYIGGEFQELAIYRSSTGYHLIVSPEEDS